MDFPPGWYARNGLDLGDKLLAHPLDAVGRVDRVAFPAPLGNRQREAILESKRVDVPSGGRGMFGSGTQFGFSVQNTANTSLFRHGERLFAMWEGGLPTELDDFTLRTLGHSHIAGARGGLPVTTGHAVLDVHLGMGGDAVSAHPLVDPMSGRAVLLLSSINVDASAVNYRIVELQPDDMGVERERLLHVPGFTHVHGGMFITRDYYILITPCMSLDIRGYVCGQPMADCIIHQQHAPTTLHVIPRCPGGSARSYEMPRCFVTHGVNAYQTYDAIVIDAMVADCLPDPMGGHRDLPDVRMRRIILHETRPPALDTVRIKSKRRSVKAVPKKAMIATAALDWNPDKWACIPRLVGGHPTIEGRVRLSKKSYPMRFPLRWPDGLEQLRRAL